MLIDNDAYFAEPKSRKIPCSSCKGSGLMDSIAGPTDCDACNGQCVVTPRDDKGRFTKDLK